MTFKRNMELLVFGDQTGGFHDSLRGLLSLKQSPALISLLQSAFYALKQTIGRLRETQDCQMPKAASLIDFLDEYAGSDPHPALDSALHCLNQLASFIVKYEHEGDYPVGPYVRTTGICNGLLAAVAISFASSVHTLTPFAIEAVLIAFRVGMQTHELKSALEHESANADSWSWLFGTDAEIAQQEILAFGSKNRLAGIDLPYISAVSTNCVTISGRPSVIRKFCSDTPLGTCKPVELPIFAPYHAPHLFNDRNIRSILDVTSQELLGRRSSSMPIGLHVDRDTFGTALEQALHQILIERVDLNQLVEESTASAIEIGTPRCTLIPIAAPSLQGIATAMIKNGLSSVVIAPDLAEKHRKPSTAPNNTGRPEQSKLAIVGFGGRFPEANSLDEFWQLLQEGRDVHREIPADRFDANTHYDPTGKRKNTSKVKHGCFIREPGLFDEKFFNMSPREAANTDPAQRLAITTAYEAMEMAGMVPDRTPSTRRDRVGIFYGMTSDDWREVNSNQDTDTYFIPGGNRAFTPGRLNYHFKFCGPSFSIDTACSSSLAALNTACNALWRGDCDTAIAGGVNILTNPDNFAGLDRGHFLSPDGNCNTFDDGANGYCRADAIATVIVKRLEDAQADGDPIHGVILATGTNHSAEAESMTRPHTGAQVALLKHMLNTTGLRSTDVDYIEMHGTGTQAGDATEMRTVLQVFAQDQKQRGDRPLYVGSVKSNIGHSESASGVSALIKVLLMMKANAIPPHCGIKTKINHNFPLDMAERNLHIAFKSTEWARPTYRPRRSFVNNFSAAGGNSSVLLEDGPIDVPSSAADPRATQVVAVSAKTKAALHKNIEALCRWTSNNLTASLSDLAYTTTARRMHYSHRAAFSVSSVEELQKALVCQTKAQQGHRSASSKKPKIVFLFTGQGAFKSGMGKMFFDNFSQFREDVLLFEQIATGLGFGGFVSTMTTPTADLSTTSVVVTQLGQVAFQMALVRLWKLWGVEPASVLGHSLGEYAALYAAGVLSARDVIYLAGTRAELLLKKCTSMTHAMLSVRESAANLRKMFGTNLPDIACINGPCDTVLAGSNEDIEAAMQALTAGRIKNMVLKVPYAFHSAQVEPVLEDLKSAATKVNFCDPQVPYLSPLLGTTVHTGSKLGGSYLANACRSTVNFDTAVRQARDSGAIDSSTVWIEIGPHPICSAFVKAIAGTETVALATTSAKQEPCSVLTGTIATLYQHGVDVNWSGFHGDFAASTRLIQLPSYQWDAKNHWIQYRNDFTLMKGAPPAVDLTAPPLVVQSDFPTTASAQKVIKQSDDYIEIESDLAYPPLKDVIQGHRVNGTLLCPSSLWADVALTLARYLADKHDRHSSGLNVSQMSVQRPLVAEGGGKQQLYRASARLDAGKNSVSARVWSAADSSNKNTVDHAHCIVKFEDTTAWKADWQRSAYLVKAQIDSLHSLAAPDQVNQVRRGVAYKLFSSLVDYSSAYQGMERVAFDSSKHEASAVVRLQAEPHDGFVLSPYCIDSLGHLAGFTMNANIDLDSKTEVYINHGWDGMQVSRSLSKGATYHTYVRMQDKGQKLFAGDVWILEGEEVVAVYTGVQFKGVPRQVLDGLKSAAIGTPKKSGQRLDLATPAPNTRRASPQATIPPMLPLDKLPRPCKSTLALSILAKEIGVSVAEMAPESAFDDFGLDSLLSLTVIERLNEELGIEVDSLLFTHCSTVEDFLAYIDKLSGMVGSAYPAAGDSSSMTTTSSTPLSSCTPTHSGTVSRASSSAPTSLASSECGGVDQEFAEDCCTSMQVVRSLIAEEVGVSVDEITPSVEFSELGLDSLLSLNLTSRLREDFNMDIPANLFVECSTLTQVAAALGIDPGSTQVDPLKDLPPATSVLLQGPRTAACTKKLFLFPDGSGSATCYLSLPNIDDNTAVYGLNCPFLKDPDRLRTTRLADLTLSYIAEIRRRQPTGPYYLGGWSAGGICAFDAAQRLTAAGETVNRLILLDSPFPIGIGKLPPRMYDFLDSLNMFGGEDSRPAPAWLLPHFLAFIDSLDTYEAQAFAPGTAPETFAIWATDGVCKDKPLPDLKRDDPKEMAWILTDRKDFGSNGWDGLLPGARFRSRKLEGANHFSMMKGGNAKALCLLIKEALA